MKKIKIILLTLIVNLVMFCACDFMQGEKCEDRSNPTFYFSKYHSIYYDFVTVEGTKIPYSTGKYGAAIPFNLTSDTSMYILTNAQRVDTLAISYKRKGRFESAECGFSMEIRDIKLLKSLSSFDSIDVQINTSTKKLFGVSNVNTYEIYTFL